MNLVKKRNTQDWVCMMCGTDTFHDYTNHFTLTEAAWSELKSKAPQWKGIGTKEIVCLKCTEFYLGRKLTKEDLVNCYLNTTHNPYTKQILNQPEVTSMTIDVHNRTSWRTATVVEDQALYHLVYADSNFVVAYISQRGNKLCLFLKANPGLEDERIHEDYNLSQASLAKKFLSLCYRDLATGSSKEHKERRLNLGWNQSK